MSGSGGRRFGKRSLGASAVVAAVVGGLVGPAPLARALPAPLDGPGGGANTSPNDLSIAQDGPPAVWPRPQSLRERGTFVPLDGEATIIADREADPYALESVRTTLREAGVRTMREVRPGDPVAERGPLIRVGAGAAGEALQQLRAPERGDLPAGGYRLAVGRAGGRDTVALAGTGRDGLFHAAQTLRQLVTEHDGGPGFAGVTVRDWPVTAVRGVTEGFFGEPWDQRERLAQLDFLGRTKQNRYLYAPGDDPYRQATRWRDPYPAGARADFRALAERAERNHVVLAWAVSPGQSLCFSSADDRRGLLRKLDAMRALGFEAFQLQFDDVSYQEWHCDADADTYGTGPEAAARAQAELANAVSEHLGGRTAGRGSEPAAAPLSVLPTEFYQEGRTAYRKALAKALADRVEVAWTGVGVVPRTITGEEVADLRGAFPSHPLVTMDNYPVNDYAPDRLFLGPYQGREPAVASGSEALLANAMAQPTASRIPLFTAADYAWNPRDYRPQESWQAAIEDLAGPDRHAREAVRALARNDASSMLGGTESAHLQPLIEDFWDAHARGVPEKSVGAGESEGADGPDASARKALASAAEALRAAFRGMRQAPDGMPEELADEVRPWLRQLSRFGTAGETCLEMLVAQAEGDGPAAWQARLEAQRLRTEAGRSSATVGKGVLAEFVDRALESADSWSGVRAGTVDGRPAHGGPAADSGSSLRAAADGDAASAYRAAAEPGEQGGPDGQGSGDGGLTVELPEARPLGAVTVLTGPDSDTRADIEVRVPGEGWKRVGRLSGSGWTQADAEGVRADAVRLVWRSGSEAPVVHEIVPWYADAPAAALTLSRDETYAAIGGDAFRLTAKLSGRRPATVTGPVTVEAPKGFTVRAPSEVTVPRGGTAKARISVTVGEDVKPGSYEIPVSFRGQQKVLTVRAFPRTGGPDLAREAKATSSADETQDFPASAVADGDADTRWSSPPGPDAWVQLELDRPARVGEVRLHWQEAYAERYRIQVSPDGRRWRTAATVREGEGGHETVRLDAPEDTRFVRVQGDKRATRFGYSLFSVQVYAVRTEKD